MGTSTAGCSDASSFITPTLGKQLCCFHKPYAENEALDTLVFQSVQQRHIGPLPSRPASR